MHLLFRKFVQESEASHDDLLIHNNMCWLNRGKAMERLVELRHQVVVFFNAKSIKLAADQLRIMQDTGYMCNVVFLTDLFSNLNALNLQLQRKDKPMVNMVEKLDAFGNKLSTKICCRGGCYT